MIWIFNLINEVVELLITDYFSYLTFNFSKCKRKCSLCTTNPLHNYFGAVKKKKKEGLESFKNGYQLMNQWKSRARNPEMVSWLEVD